MEPEFWHGKWRRREIGFHQEAVNPYLQAHWHRLGVAPGKAVLVPLCGKSLDLWWIAGRGVQVTGVELSPVAVAELFAEAGREPLRDRAGAFARYRSGGLTVLQGDFFGFEPERRFAAAYDRAALIALPPSMRRPYAERLGALLAPAARVLLVTLEYPRAAIEGPPFCVPAAEVSALFASWDIEELQRVQVQAAPRLRAGGLEELTEVSYLLTAPGSAG